MHHVISTSMNAAKYRVFAAMLLGCVLSALNGCASRVVTLYDAVERSTEQISVLRLPFEMEVVAIDGKKFKGTLPVAKFVNYEILPGNHEVVLRYFQAWQDDDHNNEFVKSPLIAIGLDFEPGATYRVNTEKPKNIAQARTYASALTVVAINDATGKSVSSVLLPASRQEGGLLQNLFKKSVEPSDGVGSCLQGGVATTLCTPMDQLNFWWGRATDEERARFKQQLGAD